MAPQQQPDNQFEDYIEDFLIDESTIKRRNVFRRAFYVLVVVIAVAVFGILAIYAERFGEIPRDPNQLPVIEADATPFKMQPEDPGGIDVPNQDKSVYDNIAGKRELPKVEQILPEPEKPITREELVGESSVSAEEADTSAADIASKDTLEATPETEDVSPMETVVAEPDPSDIAVEDTTKPVEVLEEVTEVVEEDSPQVEELQNEEIELLKETESVDAKEAKDVEEIKKEVEDIGKEKQTAKELVPGASTKKITNTMDYLREQKKEIEERKKQLSSSEYLKNKLPVEQAAPVEVIKPAAAIPATPTKVEAPVVKPEVKKVETSKVAPALKESKIVKQTLFRLQLGAFKTEGDARKAWNDILKLHQPILGGAQPFIEKADLGTKGIYYRLKAGPFDNESAARQACTKLREKNQGCFFVKE